MVDYFGGSVGFDAFLVIHINITGNIKVAEMFLDQRFYVIPVQPVHAAGKTRQREAAEFFFLHHPAQGVQAVVDMLQRGMPGFAAMRVSGILREQVDQITAVGAHPRPQFAGFGVLRLAVMAEILVHGRHAFAQLQREAVMEVIIRRHALDDGFGAA